MTLDRWLGPEGIIAFGVIIGLVQQWRTYRKTAKVLADNDQKTAATLATHQKETAAALSATSEEAKRAAEAAQLAAALVAEKGDEHTAVLTGVAENITEIKVDLHKVEVHGNSNATRLEEAARAQGHLAGVAEAEAKRSE